jgi:hypothetical protein
MCILNPKTDQGTWDNCAEVWLRQKEFGMSWRFLNVEQVSWLLRVAEVGVFQGMKVREI